MVDGVGPRGVDATRWTEVVYREFYDVPRVLVFTEPVGLGRVLMLDCPFDADADAYPSVYRVYQLPDDIDLSGSWEGFVARAVASIGWVPVHEVVFDPSRRRRLDASTVRPRV